VTADPLTPRYTNADELLATRQRGAARQGGVRSFGAPVSTGLPTAGYVNTPAPQPAEAGPSMQATDTGAVVALSPPADESERILAPDPVYPASALHDRVEGWIELAFTVTETGAVRDVEVLDAQPRGVFEAAATQAIVQWRFRPRLANGQPVKHRSSVTVRFSLDD
jgi:TonB family protein